MVSLLSNCAGVWSSISWVCTVFTLILKCLNRGIPCRMAIYDYSQYILMYPWYLGESLNSKKGPSHFLGYTHNALKLFTSYNQKSQKPKLLHLMILVILNRECQILTWEDGTRECLSYLLDYWLQRVTRLLCPGLVVQGKDLMPKRRNRQKPWYSVERFSRTKQLRRLWFQLLRCGDLLLL